MDIPDISPAAKKVGPKPHQKLEVPVNVSLNKSFQAIQTPIYCPNGKLIA